MSSGSSASPTEGTILAKSSNTTTLPDGSQRIEELIKVQSSDGSVSIKRVVRTTPAARSPHEIQMDAANEYQQAPQFDNDDIGDEMSELSQTAGSTSAVRDWQPSVQGSETAGSTAAVYPPYGQQPFVQDAEPIFEGTPSTGQDSILEAQVTPPGSIGTYPSYPQSYATGDGYMQPGQSTEEQPTSSPGGNQVGPNVGNIGANNNKNPSEGREFWTKKRKIGGGLVLLAIIVALAAALGVILSGSPTPTPDNPDPVSSVEEEDETVTTSTAQTTTTSTTTQTTTPSSVVTTHTAASTTPSSSTEDGIDCPESSLTIMIFPDLNTGGPDGDQVNWRLVKEDPENMGSNEIVLSSDGPMENSNIAMVQKCVEHGRYTFYISDSGGDGFGEGTNSSNVGYVISSGDVVVGLTSVFFDGDAKSFTLPYYGEVSPREGYEGCDFDFELALTTHDNPTDIVWEVKDDTTEHVVLRGGPYDVANGIFTHSGCLDDGQFTFNINFGPEGYYPPNMYVLYIGDQEVVSNGTNFASEDTVSFTLPYVPQTTTTSTTTTDSVTTTSASTTTSLEFCHKVQIEIGTGTNEDEITWELFSRESGKVIASGGPLENGEDFKEGACVAPGRYSFNITDTGGDGVGEDIDQEQCPTCGYSISVDNVFVGGAFTFWYNEIFTFPVPYLGDEPDFDDHNSCGSDIFVAVQTDGWPQETSWNVTDVNGNLMLSGGPYSVPYTVYSQRSCLPDDQGPFNFTIYDTGSDGVTTGVYLVSVEGNELVRGDRFGSSNSTIFTVGSSGSIATTTTTSTATTSSTSTTTSTLVSSTTLSSATTSSTSFLKFCYDVTIYVKTDINTGAGDKEDYTTWELYSRDSGEVLYTGGPLGSNRTYNNDICLQPGLYTFNITDDGTGDGFGECDDCGFVILVDDVAAGVSSFFSDNEELTFPVPFAGDEPDDDDDDFCTSDFLVAVKTDGWPQETSWELTDAEGDLVLSGGPYWKSSALYIERSCLTDSEGPFNFTIYDTDGLKFPAEYLLYVEGELLAEGGNFVASNSTVFTVGTQA